MEQKEQDKYYHTIQEEINKVYKGLYDALYKYYNGDGLFINIDDFVINDPIYLPENSIEFLEEDNRRQLYTVSGTYGRNDEQGDPNLNFIFPFKIWCADEDSSDFIGGIFYTQLEKDDFGDIITSEDEN